MADNAGKLIISNTKRQKCSKNIKTKTYSSCCYWFYLPSDAMSLLYMSREVIQPADNN